MTASINQEAAAGQIVAAQGISVDALLALMPLITLAVSALVLMLLLCVVRNHLLSLGVTLIGFVSAFLNVEISSQSIAAHEGPVVVAGLLVVDNYFVFFSRLILIAGGACALQAYQYFRHSKPAGRNCEEFYILLLFACLGALVLVASQHFAGFFLGLELMGISLFAMIAFPVGCFRKSNNAVRHSLEAALKYLVLSSIASAFLLLGIAFIYAQTGALSFDQLQQLFNPATSPGLAAVTAGPLDSVFIQLALVLLLIGIGFKLSLVPFHMWTPDVYQGAPTPVTAFVATVAKGAVVAALMRFFIVTDAYHYQPVVTVLSVMAVVTMVVGNLLALTQHNIKRILAYSSIAHIGYLFVAFLAAASLGKDASLSVGDGVAGLAIEAVAFYIAAYFVTTLGAFAVISAVSEQGLLTEDRYSLRRYRGLFWRQPWVASCFIFMLLSLAGIPLTMGFIGKFYIFAAGAQSELWLLLMAVVLGSAIGLYYYLRIIIALMQRESEAPMTHSSWAENALIFSLTGLLILFGVYPTPLIEWIQVI